ncbi:MAG TPA: SAM-dependent methyltransferase, partial [Candidatus Kapabacteria bacterium]|nr:SAM-dependent methyltransferase [Candidatus Kapabacteria bacterium]
MSDKEYLLGINQTELERLQFQHGVWKKVTGGFLDRLGVQKGWKCLDAGAGPGFVSLDILERIGSNGEITLVEPSGE